jgi:GT2 family glycosyltransferase
MKMFNTTSVTPQPRISIIVPLYHKRLHYLQEFLEHCEKLDYENYEIIILSNISLQLNSSRTRIIITDKRSQGEKFDIGIAAATGEICAFVGDDTYPRSDWLEKAIKYFRDPEVVAVGGPGLTPPNDSMMQHASGLVYSSLMGGGFASFRYTAKRERLCDDLPATNLLVSREALLQVGGISVPFRSGEDTFLCMKLSKLGKKILYAPDVVVFHHRRPLFRPHARQVWNAAIHRGYFAKRFGGNSRRIGYFLPSLAVISGCVLPLIALLTPQILPYILSIVGIYLAGVLLSALAVAKRLHLALIVSLGIILTHLTYGVGFLRGLLLRDEKKLLHKD